MAIFFSIYFLSLLSIFYYIIKLIKILKFNAIIKFLFIYFQIWSSASYNQTCWAIVNENIDVHNFVRKMQ
jgi:hypothetical protein